ncbi:hypothetical protein HAV22_29870 [Massilia sp. TW-1]|uniref:Uncharacterized protein n=1 Tax=Telluria antibiotica TaxID=2717319 RepID=A0ABX0PKH2_9BURK|nr:hypothetical protein [Telluria antibiotica]NIA57841.1 hypothetical protein [Telluria antibiotica]
MRDPIHKLLSLLLVLACMHPSLALACAVLPNDKAAERSRQIVDEAKAATLKLKDDADQIFIGYLKTFDVEKETVDTPHGKQAVLHYVALFDSLEEIKGHYPKERTLEFTVNPNEVRVPVGCRPQYWQLPKGNGAGEMYLVYARDGKLLRTNHIPMDRQAMSGYEEAAFVRDR